MRAMCHHHLVAYQLKREENNSVEKNRKIKKIKERGRREKEKGKEGVHRERRGNQNMREKK